MIYDLMFMYQQFYQELPETYEQFATSVNKDFMP